MSVFLNITLYTAPLPSFCHLPSLWWTRWTCRDSKMRYVFCGIQPVNPTKQHIREHCRVKIPQPRKLIQRVEEVDQHFHLSTDPNSIPLFKPSMVSLSKRATTSPGQVGYRHTGVPRAVPGPGPDRSWPLELSSFGGLEAPSVCVPSVFDPALIHSLNKVYQGVLGEGEVPCAVSLLKIQGGGWAWSMWSQIVVLSL